MPSIGGDKDSIKSLHSSVPSSVSYERPISVHDHAVNNGDLEKIVTPEVLPPSLRLVVSHNAASIATNATNDPDYEVDWDGESDPMNPRNWSIWYKAFTIFCISWSTWSVVVYSTSYTTGLAEMQQDFGISSEPLVTLGVTSYLIGIAFGSMLLAPISEMYGRRPVYIASMTLFTILIIPCGLATSLPEVIVVRFFGALAGSAMIANSPGTVSDIVNDDYRALAFSIWSIGPLNGPTFGPIIGGFSTQYLGWRWTNWIVMIISGIAFIFMCVLKETYAPALLRKKAKLRRKEQDENKYWSRYDSKIKFWELLKINLSRPFVMLFTESICIFWDVYIAIIYGILYLCFVAYPIVFTGVRGWSAGISGLAFTGLAVGCFLVIGTEPLLRRMINSHKKDPETGKVPPEAMVSVVCIAAVLVPVGELWFAWTCVPPVHYIWPILAGIPFGAGNTAVFIYASNYLAHSYGIYAASAMAGNSVIRSLLGGTLPLAGPAMYAKLDPHWAGTLLGLIQVAIIPIPVVFYKYGDRIRMKSALIQSMQQDKERLESKRRSGLRAAQIEKEEEEIVKIYSKPV
ncbi:benomyl/methotrexate resistance protein [Usnea florida]